MSRELSVFNLRPDSDVFYESVDFRKDLFGYRNPLLADTCRHSTALGVDFGDLGAGCDGSLIAKDAPDEPLDGGFDGDFVDMGQYFILLDAVPYLMLGREESVQIGFKDIDALDRDSIGSLRVFYVVLSGCFPHA